MNLMYKQILTPQNTVKRFSRVAANEAFEDAYALTG